MAISGARKSVFASSKFSLRTCETYSGSKRTIASIPAVINVRLKPDSTTALQPRTVESGFSRIGQPDVESCFSRIGQRDVESGFSRILGYGFSQYDIFTSSVFVDGVANTSP